MNTWIYKMVAWHRRFAAATGLKLEEQKFRLKFEEVRLGWETDLERLKIKDLKTRLYGGEVTGGAVVPLSEKASEGIEPRVFS